MVVLCEFWIKIIGCGAKIGMAIGPALLMLLCPFEYGISTLSHIALSIGLTIKPYGSILQVVMDACPANDD